MMETRKTKKKTTKKTNPPKEEEFVLTKEKFLEILERVIQPVPVQAKPPKKGKKGTSE